MCRRAILHGFLIAAVSAACGNVDHRGSEAGAVSGSGAASGSGADSTGTSGAPAASASSTGSGDPSGDKQPVCEALCDGNYACTTEAEAACGDTVQLAYCSVDASCEAREEGAYCRNCGGHSYCVSACSRDSDCVAPYAVEGPFPPAWEECIDGRCQARTCGTDADCPPNFACAGSACVRKSCETDADCEGSCVLHECQTYPGYCLCGGC